MVAKLANKFTEVIFLGVPGPTHNYGGLSADNMASSTHQGRISRPREAALQVLALARLLMSLGITVGLLPPQLRPHIKELKKRFPGDDRQTLLQALLQDPLLVESMSSSSAMWVANAATVTPPMDAVDHHLHLTVANLHTNLHRRIEALDTYLTLRQIFALIPHSIVDLPLPAESGWRDEGAANHMRLAPSHHAPGLHVFVYGTDGNPRDPKTARQNLSASQEIIARHHLEEGAAICVKQNPNVIEQGVFHNDVIAVSNENLLLVHEDAYAMGGADLAYIADSYRERTGQELIVRMVTRSELSVEEAVNTYFFNSQLLTLPDGGMTLIAPAEAQEMYDGKAWALMEKIVVEKNNPIRGLHSVDLRQSMQNGGGPACLRLRVPMDDAQIATLRERKRVLLDEAILCNMEDVVSRNYPESLTARQIDYDLYLRCKEALTAIGIALGLELLPA